MIDHKTAKKIINARCENLSRGLINLGLTEYAEMAICVGKALAAGATDPNTLYRLHASMDGYYK